MSVSKKAPTKKAPAQLSRAGAIDFYLRNIPAAIRAQFWAELQNVARRLKTDPVFLLQVMHAETAGTMRTDIQNKDTNATGLIQFMPSTARGLGTTVDALKSMNHVQQLRFVEAYFRPFSGRLNTYQDVYFATFFPAAIGRSDTWVLKTQRIGAGTIARQNPAVNINKDGQITVGEFKEYLRRAVPQRLRNVIFSPATIPVLLLGVVALFVYYGSK
jgi:hypothetical protein